MVGGFLKAFKSKTQRIILTQNSDLYFSEIEKLTPSDLEKVVAEEEAAKKSAFKQQKKSKKKATSEKPPSENPLESNLFFEGVSTEVGPKADDITLVPDDQSVDSNLIAPESGIDIDVYIFFSLLFFIYVLETGNE